ncbi:MAG: Ig-like domain-containing protein [Lachnospiraceae bacterium]|nr:Ig-like domain-containing protein [Lachnospiraceae bacterium]
MGKRVYRVLALMMAVLMVLALCPAQHAQAKKKKADAKLDKKTVETTTREQFTLKLKSSHKADYYYVDFKKFDEEKQEYESVWSCADYSDDGKGKFTIQFRDGGLYEVTITIVTTDWEYYSDTCEVTVKNIGPSKRNMALLINTSEELVIDNATFVSAKVKEEYNYWDYWNYWYDDDDDYDNDDDSDDYDSGYDDYYWNNDDSGYNEDYWNNYDNGYNWDDYDYDYDDDYWNNYDYWNSGSDEDEADYEDDYYDWNSYSSGSSLNSAISSTGLNSGSSASNLPPGSSDNSDLISKAYYYSRSDEDYSSKGEVSIDGAKITGVKTGSVTLIVTYTLADGTSVEDEIYVDITDPVYKPFEGYFLADRYLYPEIEGYSSYSEISYETSNEDICEINRYGIYLKGAGSFKLTITVDGRKFTDRIEVYAPEISDDALLIKKKKSETVTVTGLPDGITPKYKTGNKKIATVSKDGKIKAKAEGSTYITVTCGDLITYTCYVTVSKGGTAYKAAKAAYDSIGGLYSQDYRMKDGYYDCSSLAWRSYKEAGECLGGEKQYAPTAANLCKSLEEDGKAIAHEYIEADELQPGDLIFYSSGSNGRYLNIDHVAVYYAAACSSDWNGDTYNSGLIVHATSPAVHLSSYSGYCPYNIVMICRPID